ncbi:hypothetical protein TWF730_005338 [Orbilia blumenaviensis]|uniref:Glycine-rich cell wall structural protein 1 n=1 Tax=Orbilia blumenaviensis TaxID=1796055 RepID=A0AAV9VI35_9PEZI
METLNQATAALKETIWGNGSDNTNPTTTTTDGTTTTTATTVKGQGNHSEIHKSMIDDSVTETKFNGRLESDPDSEGSYKPSQGHENDNDKRPQGPISTGGQPQGANVTGEERDTNKNTFSSSNEPNTGFGGSAGAQPSVSADPSSAQQDTPHHQGGDKPTAEPDTSSTGSGSSGVSGAGSMGGSVGGPGGPGGMKLPESDNKSKGEGTGTKYEKSTGLAAEGGDFDATRPGAAREAARLMDEKGIAHGGKQGDSGEPKKEKKWYGVDHSGFGGHGSHQNRRPSASKPSSDVPEDDTNGATNTANTTTATTATTGDTTADQTHTEKKGLTQKIKEKLHHSSD